MSIARRVEIYSNEEEVVTIRCIKKGTGKRSVICIHPISGMITAYAQLVKCMPHGVSVFGIEVNRDFDRNALRVGVRDLALRYSPWVSQIAQHGPTALAGWCIGADVSVELGSILSQKSNKLSKIFAIDPNFKLNETHLARATIRGGEIAETEFWKFFILMACGSEFIHQVMSSDEYQKCQNDAARVECVYRMRRTLTNRGPIKVYPENPCWQFNFIKMLTEQSRDYNPPVEVQFPLTIVASSKDEETAREYAAGMNGPSITVSLFDSNHYGFMEKPIINEISQSILENLEVL